MRRLTGVTYEGLPNVCYDNGLILCLDEKRAILNHFREIHYFLVVKRTPFLGVIAHYHLVVGTGWT